MKRIIRWSIGTFLVLASLGVIILYFENKYNPSAHFPLPDYGKEAQNMAMEGAGNYLRNQAQVIKTKLSNGETITDQDKQNLEKYEEMVRLASSIGASPKFPRPSNPDVAVSPTPANRGTARELIIEEVSPTEFDVQLDARLLWSEIISLEGHSEIELVADRTSVACSPPDPCAGPSGRSGFAKNSLVNPEDFPLGEGMAVELIGKFENQPAFRIGTGTRLPIPPGTQKLYLMSNIRTPYLHEASEGHRVKIKLY